MKYQVTVLLLIISFTKVVCQNSDSTIKILEPLDWEIMYCGKTDVGLKEPCRLIIMNKTEHTIQGYWLNHFNTLAKVKFGRIEPNTTKTWNIKVKEYWVFADSNNNALGIYQTKAGTNEIIITKTEFLNTKKLSTNIIDNSFSGTISGGKRVKEQAAYDVTQYDINMEIFPDKKYITATNTISAIVTEKLNYFVFSLDTLLKIKNVFLIDGSTKVSLDNKFQEGKYWCKLPESKDKGDILKVCVEYEGYPRYATNPPYQGGFSWNKTENCQHWIATSCQIDGADLWFPCKDYQWDEPDSVKLSFTVPSELKAISNGILKNTIHNSNHTTTYIWIETDPINNYDIALNIAPYIELKDEYISLYGDTIPIFYWFLPENEKKAKHLYPNIKNYLDFIETTIGPYPFRNEKLGLVEVPFVGMEHQTITAFGPNFTEKYPGYNYVLFHELCHEWFGNMVTAYDWSDFWIQEALTGYTEALYEEYLQGETGYKKKMDLRRKVVQNKIPLATDSIVNSREAFNDFSYGKAVFLIHSLRYLIGKENIIKVLRLMAYPNEQLEHETTRQQCRFVTTRDLFQTIEDVCGKNYDWFKDVYLYHAEVPFLEILQNENEVMLRWKTKDNLPFNMPLEIKTKNGIQKINFNHNKANIDIARDKILEFDPNHWILFNIKE